jgi:hypothetical protein
MFDSIVLLSQKDRSHDPIASAYINTDLTILTTSIKCSFKIFYKILKGLRIYLVTLHQRVGFTLAGRLRAFLPRDDSGRC